MEKLAQLMASWAEPSPAVAALAALRSQRVEDMPHLAKAGGTDSTAPITVIEHFHGTGLAHGAGRFDGVKRPKDAGLPNGAAWLNATVPANRTDRVNSTDWFSGTTLPNGTGWLNETGPVNSAGRLNSTGALNGAKQLKSQAKDARAAESTGAKATDTGPPGGTEADASVINAGCVSGPRREALTGASPDPDQWIQRPRGLRLDPVSVSGVELGELLDDAAALLDSARLSVIDEVRLLGFVGAADFAGRVEELSRSVEFLQVVAAQAVERTRREAQQVGPGSSAAAPEWRTGWTEPATGATVPGATKAVDDGRSVVDDGYRDAAQFLRARLRISIGEARRRLALAPEVLPQTGMTGQDIPARREILADAVGAALVPSRSATIISTALDKVRHLTDDETITRMEQALTGTAVETDPDFLTKMTKRWIDYIDHDGPEPSEEVLRQHQGAFLRRRRRYGLHHIEIFATDEQYETLTTVMNTATNPRLTTTTESDAGSESQSDTGAGAGPVLDLRTRPQKHLNGLLGACSVAMTTGKLPSNGGLRPQLTVTIGYQELLNQLNDTRPHEDHGRIRTGSNHGNGNGGLPSTGAGTGTGTGTGAGKGTGTGTRTGSGSRPGSGSRSVSGSRSGSGTATFLGPIHPNTIRKIACDADILPVLLGSDSRVLDIGRTTRIFPPHIRKAITARDGGCAFPDCTMPAPWCEAHHTTYWSHGGTTSTDNGTLLCSHHHHLIHKEQWRIDMTTGVPWFIPPPHIDPQQTPRQNHHHTPQRTKRTQRTQQTQRR
ncbi:DUF222 domain-containing protein [Paenarthrobacter sp. NPDC091711]|uniref:HNH endonuclease signature motif containing protein n=1 Tax=Paenarthrobacter sp. NPDC091711 TaxID=3364385 RepID=UPI00380173C3